MNDKLRPSPLRVALWFSWACVAWFVAGVLVWFSSGSVPRSVEEMSGFGLGLAGALGLLFAFLFLAGAARSKRAVLQGGLALILNAASLSWFYFLGLP
jgi:hypothetical protein